MLEKEELVYTVFYVMLFWVLVLIAIVAFVYKARKKIFDKELEKKDLEIKFQKEILLATILTQEKERERIAQDLHDEISSKLNVVSLTLHSLKSASKSADEKINVMDDIIKLNNNAIENSRKIAHNLLPPILEKFGLNAAIDELVHDFEKTKSVKINYTNNINFNTFNAGAQLNIFRIVQELLNNSIKHGKATEVTILFTRNAVENICTYTDNGLGFNTANLKQNKGLGIRNIESRILFLNGNFQVTSEKNKGIKINFSFINE
jgi:signal transduction histidine kinase